MARLYSPPLSSLITLASLRLLLLGIQDLWASICFAVDDEDDDDDSFICDTTFIISRTLISNSHTRLVILSIAASVLACSRIINIISGLICGIDELSSLLLPSTWRLDGLGGEEETSFTLFLLMIADTAAADAVVVVDVAVAELLTEDGYWMTFEGEDGDNDLDELMWA